MAPTSQHSQPLPTDEDWSYVHPRRPLLPFQCLDGGVGDGNNNHIAQTQTQTQTGGMRPTTKAGQTISWLQKERMYKDFSGDSMSICYIDNNENNSTSRLRSEPFPFDVKGKALSLRDRLVVRRLPSKEPVAVLLKMHLRWEETYKIYGFVPFVEGQEPSPTLDHDGRSLYEYASVKDKFFSYRFKMKTVDGVEWVTDLCGPRFAFKYNMVLKRQDKIAAQLKQVHDFPGWTLGQAWEVKIGPGIDPALIVAFVAIIENFLDDDNH